MEYRYRVESYPNGSEDRMIHTIRRGDAAVLEFVSGESYPAVLAKVRDYLNRDRREICLAEDKVFSLRELVVEYKSLLGILINRLSWCADHLPKSESGEVREWVTVARKKRRELSLRE